VEDLPDAVAPSDTASLSIRTQGGQWQPTRCAVLGMGKLGGQELNYSSDVDLLVVYTEEGGVFKEPPRGKTLKPALRNHQFFNRPG
jgi:glutamate-ammonia-ligase adenylyltransferase